MSSIFPKELDDGVVDQHDDLERRYVWRNIKRNDSEIVHRARTLNSYLTDEDEYDEENFVTKCRTIFTPVTGHHHTEVRTVSYPLTCLACIAKT